MLRGKLAAALAALAIIIIIIAINICLFSAVHSKEPLEEKSQYTFIRTNSLLTVIAATTLTSVLSRCPGAGAGAGGWGVEFIVFIGGAVARIVGAVARRPLGRAESGAPHTVTL